MSGMRLRKHEDRHTKNCDAGELKTDWSRAHLAPFSGEKAICAGGDDKHRHVNWPTDDRPQHAEQGVSHSVQEMTSEPQHSHEHGKQPAELNFLSNIVLAPVILAEQMKAI